MNILLINCLCSLDIMDFIVNMIVILGVNIGLFFNCLCKFVSKHMFDIIIKIIEIGVSIGTLVCAFIAFMQSVKARRYSSFETIFSQMLSLQRSFFDNQYMLNANGRPLTDEFVFMFVYLGIPYSQYDRLKEEIENEKVNKEAHKKELVKLKAEKKLLMAKREKHRDLLDKYSKNRNLDTVEKNLINNAKISICEEIGMLDDEIKTAEGEINNLDKEIKKLIVKENSCIVEESKTNPKLEDWSNKVKSKDTLNGSDLSDFYSSFIYDKSNVEYFKNCFKFIYNIVMLVEKSEIDKKDKKLYIDRIQALLNRNEMFCYFVNLVAHGNKLQGNKLVEHERYIKDLKKYKFFKDLDDKDGCFNDILSRIDSNLLDQFGIKIENRQK